MSENYRKSIASIEKLPQFTTMNVIDGQAGLIIYTSLIFDSLTIDNILNIIVLLILAGVSINIVVGENGILGKAQNAVLANREGQILEEAQMLIVEWQTEYYTDKVPLEGRSGKTESGAEVICTGGQILVTDNSAGGKVYTTTYSNEAGLGSFVDVAQDTTSQVYKATHPEEHMPATTGWEYVTGEWDTGYVIKETSTGDEFVWIPVVSPESYVKKSGAKNWCMKTGSTGQDYVIDIENNILGDAIGLSSILETPVTGTLTKPAPEADVVNNAGGFWVSRYEIGFERPDSIKDTEITNNFWNSFSANGLKSVVGVEPTRRISQTQALNLANGWKTGDNMQSGLITGTQWDMVCKFIGWDLCDTGNMNTWGNYYDAEGTIAKGHMGKTDAADSTNHYYWTLLTDGATFTKPASTRTVAATGSFTSTVGGATNSTAKKNIYDVAGNVWEWTTEVPQYSSANRVLRGGSANNEGYDNVATYRYGSFSSGFSVWYIGFRAVLYVK